MRCYYGRQGTQNFHITYAKSWDYVVKAYESRSKKDETDTDLKLKLWFYLFTTDSVNK